MTTRAGERNRNAVYAHKTMRETIDCNDLPLSFDATPLLSKVERLERREEEKQKNNGSSSSAASSSSPSLLRRVKLIELDPHRRRGGTGVAYEKTRLFLAVAYGRRTVAAQLFALELGRDGDDDDGEDDDDDLEWVDASRNRILPAAAAGGGGNEENDSVAVFPPSRAESLPPVGLGGAQQSNAETGTPPLAVAYDVACCALVPSPSVGTSRCATDPTGGTGGGRRMMTRRTVAVVLGTECGRVLSLLLHVSSVEGGGGGEHDGDDDGVRFGLGYEDVKIVEGGNSSKEGGDCGKGRDDDATSRPRVIQILPRARRLTFDEEGEAARDGNDDNDDDGDRHDEIDEHVQTIRPLLPRSMYAQRTAPAGTRRATRTNRPKIESISFCRGERVGGAPRAATDIAGGAGGEAVANRDAIWIAYGDGAIARLPSWRPFLSFGPIASVGVFGGGGGGGGDSDALNDEYAGEEGEARVLGEGTTIVPLPGRGGGRGSSPLDAPPPRGGGARRPPSLLGSSGAGGYWDLLSSAIRNSSESSGGGGAESDGLGPARALVLAGASAGAGAPPIAFLSSAAQDARSELGTAAREGGGDGTIDDDDDDIGGGGGASEDEDDPFGPATGTVVAGAAALAKGAFGAALGAVRWGFGAGGADTEDEEEEDGAPEEFVDAEETVAADDDHDGVDDPWSGRDPFDPGTRKSAAAAAKIAMPRATGGAASFPFGDVPRRFETATASPCGTLVATTDSLGRVMLFDAETERPVRMWKGMRNCGCHFAERNAGTTKGRTLYLAIHLERRGSVEAYRLRQGPRACAVAVPPGEGSCAVAECRGPSSEGGMADCFLLEKIAGEDGGTHYVVDRLAIDDPTSDVTMTPAGPTTTTSSRGGGDDGMQLKLLLQLLSPDTNIRCDPRTILSTLESIRALTDLGEALDAVSKCDLESTKGVDCSELHSRAAKHCASRLAAAMDDASRGEGNDSAARREAAAALAARVAYHDRLGRAYGVLRRYEDGARRGKEGASDGDEGEDDVRGSAPSSPWASEATAWAALASEAGNDARQAALASTFRPTKGDGEDEPLGFSKFAAACRRAGNDYEDDDGGVRLTKVKRSRLLVLRRIFRPLLQDLFVFKVVNSLFGELGINEDFDTLQKYFGEWASTLPSQDIAKANMYAATTWRPMIRWLHDLILAAYDASQRQQGQEQTIKLGDDGTLRKTAGLEMLNKFCAQMEDLPKAFLLAVVCTEAVSSASLKLEEKTYGEIARADCVAPWEELLRRLRTCLLISLRLQGDVGGGNDPMTARNVGRPDVFSVYSWIARDELCLSHEEGVVTALEGACLSSADAFHPSIAEGDDPRRLKTILGSCGGGGAQPSLRSPAGLANESDSRPLLFYFRDHARFPTRLAANRALILANLWAQTPEQLHLLRHAAAALRAVADRGEGFALATVAEIYQSRIRPACRAMLFGFGEHELSEEAVGPLLEDPVWTREFIAVAKGVLSMMLQCVSKTTSVDGGPNCFEPSDQIWPPVRECPILNSLIRKLRGYVRPSSVELHHMILFTFEMTKSIDSFESIVPSFSNLFLTGTLFTEMPPVPKGSDQQVELLLKAIEEHAAKTPGRIVDSFDGIRDVELFGKALGLDSNFVRTKYLIKMIRLGKDTSINDLLGMSGSLLDKRLFTQRVLGIVCARLDATISSLKRTKNYRGILSLLDADAIRWVREEAAVELAAQQKNNYATASLITTHSMVMRLQSMSESLDDASLPEKLDVLCLMSGTLLKAVHAQEQETVLNV